MFRAIKNTKNFVLDVSKSESVAFVVDVDRWTAIVCVGGELVVVRVELKFNRLCESVVVGELELDLTRMGKGVVFISALIFFLKESTSFFAEFVVVELDITHLGNGVVLISVITLFVRETMGSFVELLDFVFEKLLGLELCLKLFQGLLVVDVDSACPAIALVE